MSSDIGLKISKNRVPVRVAGDKDLTFCSEYPALKIHSKGSGAIAFNTSTAAYSTIATHNLGYKPITMVWVKSQALSTLGWQIAPLTAKQLWVFLLSFYDINLAPSISETNIRLGARATLTGGAGGSFPYYVFYRYIIFYDHIEQ
jgi:hypothetical protein